MKKLLLLSFLGVFLVGISVSAQAPAPLKIDFQYNVQGPDTGNYFGFSGPQRYGRSGGNRMDVTRDSLDATSGASRYLTTAIFTTAYQLDIAQKSGFPGGLRGLLLYPVAPGAFRMDDKLTVTKAGNGVITVDYVHRGVAYQAVTDTQGRLTLPKGKYQRRQVGFINAAGPQVIARDFSASGEAAGIDWAKVWDAKIPAGKDIQALSRTNGANSGNVKTGAIVNDWEDSSIFHFSGTLQFSFDGKILKISGELRPTQGAPR